MMVSKEISDMVEYAIGEFRQMVEDQELLGCGCDFANQVLKVDDAIFALWEATRIE